MSTKAPLRTWILLCCVVAWNGSGCRKAEDTRWNDEGGDVVQTNGWSMAPVANQPVAVFAAGVHLVGNRRVSNGWNSDHYVVRSTDGGISWSVLSYMGTGILPFRYLYFLDEQVGFGVSNFPGILSVIRTQDGGSTWEGLDPGTNLHMSIASPGGTEVYLYGSDRVLHSTDLGTTWTDVTSLFGAGQYDMTFIHPDTAVACGDAGLLRTVDGGASWQLVQSGTFRRIAHLNAEIGAAVLWVDSAAHAVVCHTTNGWQSYTTGVVLDWYAAQATAQNDGPIFQYDPSGTLFIGQSNMLYASSDGGLSCHVELDAIPVPTLTRWGDHLIAPCSGYERLARKYWPL